MRGVVKKAGLGLVVTLLFFAALEGLLLVAGVTPLNDRVDPYVGFAGYAPLFVAATGADGTPAFRTADAKFNWFNRQEFPAAKADGVTRVFCLGGSTTYGRPYEDPTSFCGWLRAFLPTADPSRRWEVVNAGGISYASYRVVRLMEELSERDPDLFIVYTGHNEFLERRTYERLLGTPEMLRDLGSLASGLRFSGLLADVAFPTRDVLDTEIDAVLDNSVGPEDYHRDDAMRDATLDHFRISLENMVRIGRSAGAEVLFVTPASNLRDFSPFKAEPSEGLAEASVARVGQLKERIRQSLDAEDHDTAAALAREGLGVDPRDAELLYLHGRALFHLGAADEARQAFVAAADEDVAPLRALSPMIDIVREVASEGRAGFVDFSAMLARSSPAGTPGDEHFLDHVHPSIEAHRLLSLAILDELVEMRVARLGPSWSDAAVADITDRVKGGVDEAANARALANLARVLTWAGKHDEALGVAERATGMRMEPHTVYQMLLVLRRSERSAEALRYSAEAVRLMPNVADVRKMRGVILSENGRSAEALRELEVAARLNPGIPDIDYHLGVVLSDLGQTARAEAAYRRAIDANPGNADALNNLGILFAQRGDYAGAAGWFERAVEVAPTHPDAARNLQRARGLAGG